jgi:uncharacterized membrane protein
MQFDREKGIWKEIIFFYGHLEEGSMEVFMKRDVAHEVAFIGVMTALMAVVLTLETYVFIYFIKPSPAFLSIPLFIALSMYGDWKHSFIGGTIFGCCSFVLSFVVGYTVFYNPLISILPRTLAGVAGYWILHGLTAVTKKRGKDTVRAIAAALTVILHTVLVLGAMEIFSSGGAFFDTVWQTIIGINFLSEIACAIFLTPILLRVMKKYTKTPDFIPLKKVKMKSEVTMNNSADEKSEAEL